MAGNGWKGLKWLERLEMAGMAENGGKWLTIAGHG